MAKLKTSVELADDLALVEPLNLDSTPLRSSVELTSADLLREIEAKANALQAEAVAAAHKADEYRRSHAGRHTACAQAVNRLARLVLERKWMVLETEATIDDSTEGLLGEMLVKFHDQREAYNLSSRRFGPPHRVEMPVERNMEAPDSRYGDKIWTLLAELSGRELRVKSAHRMIGVIDSEIAGLVQTIRDSRAANGFDLSELARHAAQLALPLDSENLAVTPAEILSEVEASK